MKILLVDDDPGIHASMELLVRSNGRDIDATLRNALTLDEGIRVAEESRPDVILLDMNFPDEPVPGERVIQFIPQFDAYGAVVMLTGYATKLRHIATAKAGAVDFLDKVDVFPRGSACDKCGAHIVQSGLAARWLFTRCLNAIIQRKVRHGVE